MFWHTHLIAHHAAKNQRIRVNDRRIALCVAVVFWLRPRSDSPPDPCSQGLPPPISPCLPIKATGPQCAKWRGPELGFTVDCDGHVVFISVRGCAYNPYVGVDPSGIIPG